ncbi:hypothetical protein GCM10010329_14040 [Streptomyces spiroverticillatus]|nr:hypothetical protein GCM10010329_14040 [Streptomyces spiroverticillatus]
MGSGGVRGVRAGGWVVAVPAGGSAPGPPDFAPVPPLSLKRSPRGLCGGCSRSSPRPFRGAGNCARIHPARKTATVRAGTVKVPEAASYADRLTTGSEPPACTG